jgi:hypothetical protein
MKTHLLAFFLYVAAAGVCGSAWAADQDESSLPIERKPVAASKTEKFVRQESLEMPGVTACHQCEWRPKPHEKAAPEQCGMTPDGAPKVGVFECGFSPDCERVCNFVRCAN